MEKAEKSSTRIKPILRKSRTRDHDLNIAGCTKMALNFSASIIHAKRMTAIFNTQPATCKTTMSEQASGLPKKPTGLAQESKTPSLTPPVLASPAVALESSAMADVALSKSVGLVDGFGIGTDSPGVSVRSDPPELKTESNGSAVWAQMFLVSCKNTKPANKTNIAKNKQVIFLDFLFSNFLWCYWARLGFFQAEAGPVVCASVLMA